MVFDGPSCGVCVIGIGGTSLLVLQFQKNFSKYVLGQATGGFGGEAATTAADDLELCFEPILRLQYRTAIHQGCYYYYLQVKSVLLYCLVQSSPV